jgi:hypothetical protein
MELSGRSVVVVALGRSGTCYFSALIEVGAAQPATLIPDGAH